MLEREKRQAIQLSTDLNLRLNNEFKFTSEEKLRHLYASYNDKEKVLICSTDAGFKVPDTYFLGQIGNNFRREGVVLFERFLELFKDYNIIPSEKDGRLYLILFNKGKDE